MPETPAASAKKFALKYDSYSGSIPPTPASTRNRPGFNRLEASKVMDMMDKIGTWIEEVEGAENGEDVELLDRTSFQEAVQAEDQQVAAAVQRAERDRAQQEAEHRDELRRMQ